MSLKHGLFLCKNQRQAISKLFPFLGAKAIYGISKLKGTLLTCRQCRLWQIHEEALHGVSFLCRAL